MEHGVGHNRTAVIGRAGIAQQDVADQRNAGDQQKHDGPNKPARVIGVMSRQRFDGIWYGHKI